MAAFDYRDYKNKAPRFRYATEQTTVELKNSVPRKYTRKVELQYLGCFIIAAILAIIGVLYKAGALTIFMILALLCLFLYQKLIGTPHILGSAKNAKMAACNIVKVIPGQVKEKNQLNININGKSLGGTKEVIKKAKNNQIFYETENNEELTIKSFISNVSKDEILDMPEGTQFIYVKTIYGPPYLYF